MAEVGYVPGCARCLLTYREHSTNDHRYLTTGDSSRFAALVARYGKPPLRQVEAGFLRLIANLSSIETAKRMGDISEKTVETHLIKLADSISAASVVELRQRLVPEFWMDVGRGNGLSIETLVHESHETSVAHGWWEGGERNFGELIALVHTELSEALEAWRDNDPPYHLVDGKPEGWVAEMADVLIRVGDTVGGLYTDYPPFDDILRAKMTFNKGRPHRHGGKRA